MDSITEGVEMFDTFEIWCYRRMLRISKVGKVTNKEVFERVGEEMQY